MVKFQKFFLINWHDLKFMNVLQFAQNLTIVQFGYIYGTCNQAQVLVCYFLHCPSKISIHCEFLHTFEHKCNLKIVHNIKEVVKC